MQKATAAAVTKIKNATNNSSSSKCHKGYSFGYHSHERVVTKDYKNFFIFFF